MSKRKISHVVGDSFAHLQNTIDNVANWGFVKLQKAGLQKKGNNSGRLERAGRKIAGFLGEAGTEYYKKYDELKQKKEKKGTQE